MTWIKRITLGLLALVALLAVAAAVFVASFDINRYKPLAIDWMKTERQRTLAIDGPIELSVFPRVAVKVSKVRLSERGRTDEFAAVDEASLSLALWPLLRRELVVDRISARGVRAVLTRDTKGVRNIDDLLGAPAPSAPPGAPTPANTTKAMRFDIGGLTLSDARLAVRDEHLKIAGTLNLASFTSGRLAAGMETPLAVKAQVTLTQPQALNLALEGQARLTFDAGFSSLALRDAKVAVRGDTAAVKGLTATIDANRLAFSTATQKLDIDALKLALAGRQGAHPFELSLDWPRLAAAGERLEGSAFSGRFKLTGPNALEGRFESGAPIGGFEALRLPGFTLALKGALGERTLDGQAGANLSLRPAAAAAALDKLTLRATLNDPGLAPIQLSVGGSASGDARGAQWALQGTLNDNRFDSQGNAAFGAAVPVVRATARFDRLDLNALVVPGRPAVGPGAPPAPAAAAPADTPVDLAGLASLNGRFDLAAGRLTFRQYQVANAKLDATLDSGLLRIQRLAGQAWGGQIDASGSAEAKSRRIAVKLNATGVNVNALLKDVAGKDLLEGTGRVTADVTTSGASLGALRSNLGGSAALLLRDGAIKGVNLARSMRQAKAALTMKQDALSKAKTTEKTDFSELSATAQIAGGVAESKDLDVKSPFLRIGGAGTFDIGRGRIDYTARAAVIGVPAGQDAGELAALRGVTVPVLLSGPFEAIDWKIQWSGVAAAAIENKLKDKLAEKLGAKLGGPAAPASAAANDPKQRLKDKLKGLFGK